jgi:hypothetical protein
MASLSPPPKLQFFDANGVPLVGGKLYSYAAGTTTPLATYTSAAETTFNTNPIILNSRGEAEVWLGSPLYKLKLTSATDVEIWTVDNIASLTEIEAYYASSAGSSYIGFIQAGPGAVARTAQDKMRDIVSVKDFGAVAGGVIDCTAAFNNALSAGRKITVPKGTYLVSSLTPSPLSSSFSLVGEGAYDSIIITNTTTGDVLPISTTFNSVRDIGFRSVNPRTSGAFINLIGDNILVDNCNFQYGYIGVESSGNLNRVQNCTVDYITPFSIAEGSCGVLCTAGILSVFGTAVSSTSLAVNNFGRAGYMVTGGELDIDQSFAFLTAYGLYAYAGPGKEIIGVNVNKCWFDSHSERGVTFQTQGDGTNPGRGIISLIWVKGSWISAGYNNTANPLGLAFSTTANIYDIIGNIFAEGNIIYNYNNTTPATGSAIFIDLPNSAANANISNNQVGVPATSVWNYGLYIPSATNFTINDNLITQNTTGIYLGVSTNQYSITDNVITGGTTPINNTSGFSGNVINNLGVNESWTAYTPTVTTASGTITTLGTVIGRYQKIGKQLSITLAVAITTNGTGAVAIQATLPTGLAAAADQVLVGRENSVTGNQCQGVISAGANIINITRYDNAYPGGNGHRVLLTGVIEVN